MKQQSNACRNDARRAYNVLLWSCGQICSLPYITNSRLGGGVSHWAGTFTDKDIVTSFLLLQRYHVGRDLEGFKLQQARRLGGLSTLHPRPQKVRCMIPIR